MYSIDAYKHKHAIHNQTAFFLSKEKKIVQKNQSMHMEFVIILKVLSILTDNVCV